MWWATLSPSRPTVGCRLGPMMRWPVTGVQHRGWRWRPNRSDCRAEGRLGPGPPHWGSRRAEVALSHQPLHGPGERPAEPGQPGGRRSPARKPPCAPTQRECAAMTSDAPLEEGCSPMRTSSKAAVCALASGLVLGVAAPATPPLPRASAESPLSSAHPATTSSLFGPNDVVFAGTATTTSSPVMSGRWLRPTSAAVGG